MKIKLGCKSNYHLVKVTSTDTRITVSEKIAKNEFVIYFECIECGLKFQSVEFQDSLLPPRDHLSS